MSDTVTLAPAPYVVIPLAATITGLSAKAIYRKIEEGHWLEGREFKRGPDGHIYISIKGYTAWVESALMSGRSRSVSRSRTKASSTERPSA